MTDASDGTLDNEHGNCAMSRAYATIACDNEDRFQSCYIAPRACIMAFLHGRPFLCLDGTHMKSEDGMVLLIATTLGANEEILPIMYGYAMSESKQTWTDFL
jgi:hypothetical protein